MKFTVETETTYVPDVYDNKELPEDEQVSVVIKTPTASETSSIAKGGEISTPDILAGVARFVKRVKNLEVNGKEITNGRELVAAEGMYVLALNVGAHILGMMTEVDKDPT